MRIPLWVNAVPLANWYGNDRQKEWVWTWKRQEQAWIAGWLMAGGWACSFNVGRKQGRICRGEKTLQDGHSPGHCSAFFASCPLFSSINFYSSQSQNQIHLLTSLVCVPTTPITYFKIKTALLIPVFDTILDNIYLGMDVKSKRLKLPVQPGVCLNAISLTVPLWNAAGVKKGISLTQEESFLTQLPLNLCL